MEEIIEDNRTEVSAMSFSPTDTDFVIPCDAITEESAQNGLETISDDVKQIETENRDSESETDEVIFPSKVKKNRNCVALDSDDDDLIQEPEKNLSGHLDEMNTSLDSDETISKNEIHTNDPILSDKKNVKRTIKRSRIKPVWISQHSGEDSSDDNKSSHFSKAHYPDKDKNDLQTVKEKLKKKHLLSESDDGNSKPKVVRTEVGIDLMLQILLDPLEDDRKHIGEIAIERINVEQNLQQLIGNPPTTVCTSRMTLGSVSRACEIENNKSSKLESASNSGVDSDDSCEGNDSIKENNTLNDSPQVRKLKKKPEEEIQKIRSESQRMVRESSVSLPYHKPKQRSLLEFLNRKRINSEDCFKPRPRDVGPVVQVLEDRVKEIEEFFKSESEESENETETEKPVTIPLRDQVLQLPSNQELSSVVDSSPTLNSIDNVPDVPENISLQSEKTQSPITSCNADKSSQPDSEEHNDTSSNHAVPKEEAGSSNSFDKATNEVKDSAYLISDGSNDSWLNSSSVFSHKEKVENVKRLSIAKVNKPTLHGRPGQLLEFDLENTSTPDQKEKVNNLIERFVQQVTKTKKSPQKKDVQISIVHKVMNADGQLELKRDVLSVPVIDNTSSECASAGRRQLIRDSLRQSISAKRAVDRMKKIENHQVENEDFQSDGKLDSELEEEILSDDSETDEDEEDYGYERKQKKKQKNVFLDEEAEDSDPNHFEDDEEDDSVKVQSALDRSPDQSDEEDNRNSLTEYKERIKKHESDDSISASKSDIKLNLKSSRRFSSFEDLTPNLNESDSSEDLIPRLEGTQNNDTSNVEELLALCSGKFPDSTPVGDTQKSQLNQMANDDESDEDVKPFSRIIPMIDDDDDISNSPHSKFQVENDIDEPKYAPLLLDDEEGKSNPNRKKKARICLSDDEDENGDEERSIVDEEEMHEEEREFRGLTDYFEDEAELSGSEVGSGDEREDEVDDWEEEEGDKEDIDENEVREQVGRAHMKTLLDQDQRDIRLFQELFLEDGDLHSDGGGRQRQFRWKNADSEEIDDSRPKTQEEEAEEGTEEQDDLTWRKMRSEREKWLQQQKSQQEEKKDVPLVLKRKGKMVKVNTKTSSNPIEKVDSSAAVNLKQYTSPKKNIAATVRRGSFLRRSEKDLSAIASLTKSVLPIQAPRTGSNFVFASITPERPAVEEKRKFKQEDSKCGSSNQNPAPAKKAKVSLSAKSIFSYF